LKHEVMHKEVAMTRRRLVLCLLLFAFLAAAATSLAAAAAEPKSLIPPYLEPAPWWWLGPKGDVYRLVIAGPARALRDPIKLPPGVKPIDPDGPIPSRGNSVDRGGTSAPKPASLSGTLAAPAGASFANASGSLSRSTRASSAPVRPDPRDVRRELESAQRALGL
jgi:hypothetical protein